MKAPREATVLINKSPVYCDCYGVLRSASPGSIMLTVRYRGREPRKAKRIPAEVGASLEFICEQCAPLEPQNVVLLHRESLWRHWRVPDVGEWLAFRQRSEVTP